MLMMADPGLDRTVDRGTARPPDVVREEDDDFAQFFDRELLVGERGIGLQRDDVELSASCDDAKDQQPAVAIGQPRSAPDLTKKVVDGVAKEVARSVADRRPAIG